MLEELGIDYKIEHYERGKSGPTRERAPESMKKVHPLGKSPTFVTKDGRVIIESHAIARYLIQTYDTGGKLQGDPATGNDEIRDEMLSSFASSSISLVMIIEMFFDTIARESPFFIRFLFNGLYSTIQKTYTTKELQSSFKYLDDELGTQDYFMGNDPGRADFMISWPVDFCTQRKYIDINKYPNLKRWHERVQARDAWKQGLNKGNGYNLSGS